MNLVQLPITLILMGHDRGTRHRVETEGKPGTNSANFSGI